MRKIIKKMHIPLDKSNLMLIEIGCRFIDQTRRSLCREVEKKE